VADFPALEPWLLQVFPWAREVWGTDYPVGREYRKHWEVVQAVRSFAEGDVLRPDATVLGIAAGNEPTIFWLTNHVERVFATDLYLSPGWEESASAEMLTKPGVGWRGVSNRRRLVVQHMDALDLAYENDVFDGIFSSSSIEHFGGVEEVSRSIEEAWRVLRPGGIFSVSTELLVAGAGPGLPGILMFTWDQLDELFPRDHWEWIEPVRRTMPSDPSVPFAEAVEYLQDHHVASHGHIEWADLHWRRYPHVVLSHEGLQWTSVHLALRKHAEV
jgi:SAM-dependent methyltransferase